MRDQNELFQYDMIASLSTNNDRLEEGCTLSEEDNNDSEWEDSNDDRNAIYFFDDHIIYN